MIKFKFVGFILSFLTAILVITNGNGSLFQNAFGDPDSDSTEDSVDEIVESAEEESDDVRDNAEDIAEEAREDTDDEARDRDSEKSEDDEDIEDESEDRGEDNSDDALSGVESEIEDGVEEIKDKIVKDGTDESPGLGEGSGMQIFVSPREIRNGVEGLVNNIKNQVVDEYNNNDDTDNEKGGLLGSLSPGKGSVTLDQTIGEFTPDDDFARSGGTDTFIPRLGLTFDEDFNNLSTGDGNEGNHIFLSPIFGGLASSPGGNDGDGNNPPLGFNIPPCTGITFCDPDNSQNTGPQGTNPDGIIEGSLNILFPTGGVGASPDIDSRTLADVLLDFSTSGYEEYQKASRQLKCRIDPPSCGGEPTPIPTLNDVDRSGFRGLEEISGMQSPVDMFGAMTFGSAVGNENGGPLGTNAELRDQGTFLVDYGIETIFIDPDSFLTSTPGGVGASPSVIDFGPCDGSGLEIISGRGLCIIDAVLVPP